MHGDVLCIRPLPIRFFLCLGIAVAAIVLAYLFAGRYTERAQVSGFLLPDPVSAPASSREGSLSVNPRLRALLIVPARWIGAFGQGSTVEVRCSDCANHGRKLAAEVMEIAPSSTDEPAAAYKIVLVVHSDISALLPNNSSPQSSTKLTTEIPLGRRPLIHWLIRPSEP
jgi:hypothetical protein